MKFNSSYWYKRATEMRSVANETKNLQSKETMLGIAHDYDLLGYQFEYREKFALRDVIRTEAFVHSAKGPEGVELRAAKAGAGMAAIETGSPPRLTTLNLAPRSRPQVGSST